MKFDLKNGFKNEFQDNNEKSCSLYRNRVSHRIDFRAVWPRNGHADSVGVKETRCFSASNDKIRFSEIDLFRISLVHFKVFIFKGFRNNRTQKHNYSQKLSLNFTQLADQKKEIITLTWIFSRKVK